jgi:hypothetical protein
VREAYESAKALGSMPAAVLQLARDAILDPSSRLFVELNYLIDSSLDEIALSCAILAQNTTSNDLIDFAKRLNPVSRANLIAHVAAVRPAGSDILCALVEAHALLDVASVYAALKNIRAKAGRAAPSLFSVHDCLKQLFYTHAKAAVASYASIEDAAAPLLACAQQTLVHCDTFQLEALERLLGVYDDVLGSRLTTEAQRILTACGALSIQPTDTLHLNELKTVFTHWILASGPLLVFDACWAPDRQNAKIVVERLRALVEDLAINRHYDIAQYLANLVQGAFAQIFQSAIPFADDLARIERVALDIKLQPLHDFIDRGRPSSAFAADLSKAGFGSDSIGEVKQLWDVFFQASATTSEEPWMLLSDLAVDFGAHTQYHKTAVALLTGLIRHGEQTSVAPGILSALQDKLDWLGADAAKRDEENRRKGTAPHKRSIKSGRQWLAAACVAACLMLGFGTAIYFKSDKPYRNGVSIRSAEAQTSAAETIPPVGAGQRLELSGVRYCAYQEERLRLMKPDIKGSEAVRLFNLLAVDYNSRCSDYFYKDSDLAMVKAEIMANQRRFAADAKRMISAWPDHPDIILSTPRGKQDAPQN